MSARNLIEMTNKGAAIYGVEFGLTADLFEIFRTTQVSANVGGRSVKIEFTETDTSPEAYRFNATVFDAESGELIATGNGGRDWEDALSKVNWKRVKNHFGASEKEQPSTRHAGRRSQVGVEALG